MGGMEGMVGEAMASEEEEEEEGEQQMMAMLMAMMIMPATCRCRVISSDTENTAEASSDHTNELTAFLQFKTKNQTNQTRKRRENCRQHEQTCAVSD